ncbi:alpha/beta hydrolase [Mycolicibacterium komossense]|uniref:Alpha/beta hydrolase n=1 Tax=Mycolicibacterium komossense TaxID=1779 RepID=A0ABT3CB67_9MYCO|nr:alpha/beta hydrolase [Mycolicibacterium komossense]MCV7226638.1 alpha/beta hydrolase [Mycolicibacterium komossense]
MSAQAPPTPVVFIHGLWMHSTSWRDWVALFEAAGHPSMAPGWPGEAATVLETRRHPEAMNGYRIGAITEHYQAIIAELPATPVVIGHCAGGLIAQRLLGRGFARAAVAIEPAPFRGVPRLAFTQIRTAAMTLGCWRLRTNSWSHTAQSYHRGIANAVPRDESDRLFHAFSIPAPTSALRQAMLANLAIHRDATVDTRSDRGPLMMIAGSNDRTVSAATVYSAYKVQRRNGGVTQLAIFDRRGHSLPTDHGWREVADAIVEFLGHHGV